jgi:hypothetical protein
LFLHDNVGQWTRGGASDAFSIPIKELGVIVSCDGIPSPDIVVINAIGVVVLNRCCISRDVTRIIQHQNGEWFIRHVILPGQCSDGVCSTWVHGVYVKGIRASGSRRQCDCEIARHDQLIIRTGCPGVFFTNVQNVVDI